MRDQDKVQLVWIIAILVVLVVLFGVIFFPISSPKIEKPVFTNQNDLGVWGPLRISFPSGSYSAPVRIRIEPELPFFDQWGEDSLILWLKEPAIPNTTYSLTLEWESESEPIHATTYQWDFQTRTPRIIFLVQEGDGAELWSSNVDGSDAGQRTQTNHGIVEYGILAQRDEMVLSVINQQGGADLWLAGRDGSHLRQVLRCEDRICGQIKELPRQESILLVAEPGPNSEEGTVAEIWMLDLSAMQKTVLYKSGEAVIRGLKLSPDGGLLAFLGGLDGQVMFYDLDERSIAANECYASEPGSFPIQGDRYVVACLSEPAIDPCKPFLQIDVESGQLTMSVLNTLLERRDYSPIEWSPDGKWALFGERCVNDRPSKQLWLVELESLQARPVTNDIRFNHANYQWDPSSRMVVFQRFELGKADGQPEILLWDLETGVAQILVQGAHSPAWQP